MSESELEYELVSRAQDVEQKLRSEVQQFKEQTEGCGQLILQQNDFIAVLEKKVEEYRNRCSRLEKALSEYSHKEVSVPSEEQDEPIQDLSVALAALNKERERCFEYYTINTQLRKQLEVTTRTNGMLSSEMNRLSEEWQSTRDELVQAASVDEAFSESMSQGRLLLQVLKSAADLQHELQSTRADIDDELTEFKNCLEAISTSILECSSESCASVERKIEHCVNTLQSIAQVLIAAIERRKTKATEWTVHDAKLEAALPQLHEITSMSPDTAKMAELLSSAFTNLLSCYEVESEALQHKEKEARTNTLAEGTSTRKTSSHMHFEESQCSAEYFQQMTRTLMTKHTNITVELNSQIRDLNKENENLHNELRKAQEAEKGLRRQLKEKEQHERVACKEFDASIAIQQTRLVDLSGDIKKYEQTVQRLQSKLSDAQRENKDLASKVALLETEVSELKKSNEGMTTEQNALQLALENVNAVNDVLRGNNEKLALNIKQVEQTRFQLSRQKSELDLKFSALSEQNEYLVRISNDLTAERDDLRVALTGLEAEKAELENTLSEKTKESNDWHLKLIMVSSQKETLDVEVKRLEERVETLEQTTLELKKKNEALMRTCGEVEEALKASLEDRESLTHNLLLCKDEKGNLEADKLEALKELSKMSKENKCLAQELEEEKAEKNRLNERIKDLKHEWNVKRNDLETVQHTLRDQLKEMEDDFAAKLAEQENLRTAEIDRLQQEKLSLKQSLEQSHHEVLEEQKKRYTELDQRYTADTVSLKHEITRVQQNLELKILELEDLQVQESVWESEKEALSKCVQQAKQELEKCQEEHDLKNTGVESELREALRNCNSLKIALDELSAEKVLEATQAESRINVLQKELDGASKQNARIQKLLEESETTCQSLQEELTEVRTTKAQWEKREIELMTEAEGLRLELSHCSSSCQQLKEFISQMQLRLDELSKEKESVLADAAEKFRRENLAHVTLSEEHRRLTSALQEALRQKEALQRELDMVEDSLKERSAEVENIAALNSQNEARERSAHQEASHWKEKVAALESECEKKHQECSNLTLKLQKEQHRFNLENEAHELEKQKWARTFQSLEEERKELEKRLLDSGQELHCERLESSSLQGRIAALESRLRVVSDSKKTTEEMLYGLYGSLHCTLGVWSKNETSCRVISPVPPQGAPRTGGPLSSSPRTVEEGKDTDSKNPSPGRSEWRQPQIKPETVVSSVESLVQHVHELEREKDETQRSISRYQRDICELRDDVLAFREKLEQAEQKIDNLNADNSNLFEKTLSQRQTIAELRREVESAKRMNASNSEQLSEISHRLTLKQQEVEKLHETSALQESRFSESLLQHDSSRCAPEGRLAVLEVEKQTLEAKVKRLRNQLQRKEEECQSLKQKLEEASCECATLSSKTKELDKRLQLSISGNTALQGELAEEKRRTMSFSETLIKETAKSTELESEKQSLERKLKDADASITALSSENRRSSTHIQELKHKVSTLESRLLDASVRIVETESVVKQHEPPSEVVDGLNHVIESLKRENKRLEKEVCTLQKQLTDTINGFITPSSSRENLVHLPTPQRSAEKDKGSGGSSSGKELSLLRERNTLLETKVRDLQHELSQLSYERSRSLSQEHRALYDENKVLQAALRQKAELSQAHECSHHLEVNALEEQVHRLKSQLVHERSFNEQAMTALHKMDSPWSDLGGLRDLLDRSLHAVSETPERLPSEAQRLSSAVEDQLTRHPGHHSLTPSKLGQAKRHTPRT